MHGNGRFSEGLDFDNTGVTPEHFDKLSSIIQKGLEKEGYSVEMRTVHKAAYHCYIKFPELLFQERLTPYREEKILIQLDTEPHYFPFEPDMFLLNRFDVFTQIKVTPPDILLAKKFYAVLNRPRNKGRDFFDIVFLLGKTKPNYTYLNDKLGINNGKILKEKVLAHCQAIGLEEMGKDVQRFLFNPDDIRKVLFFPDLIRQVDL